MASNLCCDGITKQTKHRKILSIERIGYFIALWHKPTITPSMLLETHFRVPLHPLSLKHENRDFWSPIAGHKMWRFKFVLRDPSVLLEMDVFMLIMNQHCMIIAKQVLHTISMNLKQTKKKNEKKTR